MAQVTLPATSESINPIVIEEMVGGMSCTLTEQELPYGRRHELAAFESGVEVDIAEDGIFNPGSDQVTYAVMQPRYLPLVIKGTFHDVFFPNDHGHARSQRDLLTQIAQRSNPLKVTWGDDERQGILKLAKFGEQSQYDIAYELTFFVAVPPNGGAPARQDGSVPQTDDPSDLLSQMEALAAQHQAELDAVALSTAIASDIANLFDSFNAALEVAGTAAIAFGSAQLASPHEAISVAAGLISATASAAAQASALAAYVQGIGEASAVSPPTADNICAWNASAFDLVDDLLGMLSTLRTIAQTAQLAVRKATRLYRVQDGDTLESIAQQQLGSRGRSLDLGVSQADLVPGNYIRIPEAN
jgi:hypothetical protein